MKIAMLRLTCSILTACFFVLMGVLGPGFCVTAAAAEKIRLAVPTIAIQYAPIYFGLKKGVFAAEGLDLEIHSMRTDMSITALNTAQLDFIAHGGAALRGATRGFPIKLIFALDDKAPLWLVTAPGIDKVAMLKNKKVGVSFPGDTPHLVLKRFLRRRGLDPETDVTYVAGQFSPIGFQGLVAGVLDGAVMAPPYTVLAEEKGFRMLAFLGDEVPDAPTINGIVTTDKKIRSQPDQVKRMVRAMFKSVQLYRQEADLATKFVAAEFNLAFPAAQKVYRQAAAMLRPDGEVSVKKIRDVLNLAKEAGQADTSIDSPEEIVDFSFLKEVQREAARAQKTSRP
jgi:NitT/TauT family transport system substrate-binding protein